MKHILILLAFAVTGAQAALMTTEECPENSSIVPDSCCYVQGYISDLNVDVGQTLGFHLVKDSTDTTSVRTTIKDKSSSTGIPLRIFYYIEDAKGSDALGMILNTSLALSAKNNKTPVNVIYRNDAENEDAVFLVAIQLMKD